MLEIECNFAGASQIGEILFDNMNFVSETVDESKLRTGNLIKHTGPGNITVINSNFALHYHPTEDLDTFIFQDTALCTPDDDVEQIMTFSDNTMAYDYYHEGIYNELYIEFSGLNKRHFEVIIDHNTFENMIESEKSFLDMEFSTQGEISISNNYFYN
jgi:hypothetical protein